MLSSLLPVLEILSLIFGYVHKRQKFNHGKFSPISVWFYPEGISHKILIAFQPLILANRKLRGSKDEALPSKGDHTPSVHLLLQFISYVKPPTLQDSYSILRQVLQQGNQALPLVLFLANVDVLIVSIVFVSELFAILSLHQDALFFQLVVVYAWNLQPVLKQSDALLDRIYCLDTA